MSELLEKLVREVVALRERVNALEVLEAPAPISDHGALSGLDDDDHPQYAKAADLTAHAAASAEVHGLPENVHVLGNRNAAGEFIQHGTKNATGDQARSITRGCIEAITFPVAFNSTPVVLPGGTTDNKCHLGSARAVTTTGFSLERFSTASELVNNMQWLALGS